MGKENKKDINLKELNEATAEHKNSAAFENPIELAQLRLPQNFEAQVGVKKIITTVPVRKPNRQEFIRVHPSSDWQLETAIIELKDENEDYLVAPALWSELNEELVRKIYFTTINRQGVITLWGVRLPDADGRHNDWSRSALEAAQEGMKRWVQVKSNRHVGAYEIFEPQGTLSEPDWNEDVDFQQLVNIAFKGRYIDTVDHPVIKRLRGEI